MQKIVRDGIYPPLPTFFDRREDLAPVLLQQHVKWLLHSGIAGYVVMGSNGEAVHLDEGEREQVLDSVREARGSEEALPIIAGCSALSTRTTIRYCQLAAKHGADFALVLPPVYYRGRMNAHTLRHYFEAVADASPLPLVLYNMPANTAGVDLDADTIIALAAHENIVGVKDSSGNVSKLAQVIASVPTSFKVFAGSADFLLPTLAVGGAGAVAALANVFPRQVCRIQSLFLAGKLDEARALQAQLIPINTVVTTGYGVAGLKAALDAMGHNGGLPRSPLQALTEKESHHLQQVISTLPFVTEEE
jgi:4-hydroxy-2-oxoglutarate aldolase